MEHIISYDLGTGGTKASLFTADGRTAAQAFVPCETYYPEKDFREQRPDDWWCMVVESTKALFGRCPVDKNSIRAIAVSGHSLGVVPLSAEGRLLADSVPIWSDARAGAQAAEVFTRIDEEDWYMKTGNGFPAALYSVFKILWYKQMMPELYAGADKFIGTKDYVNFKMTGRMATDHSYASGCGAYDLENGRYDRQILSTAGVDPGKMPEILNSTDILGGLSEAAAAELGLPGGLSVVCGGVDNACMAAGAGCIGEGDSYTSLGTSAWIAVSSSKPIVDPKRRPYVFAHLLPGRFVSATAIFSAGNSFKWVRDVLCGNLVEASRRGEGDIWTLMTSLAETSAPGANKLIFNPSLAGGSSLDESVNIRGAFCGLDLGHGQADIIRSAMEGISLNLRIAMDVLAEYTELSSDMMLVGGGGKSTFWRQLFADIYGKNILRSRVEEDAGALGAAAAAAVGCGLWRDFSPLAEINERIGVNTPDGKAVSFYNRMLEPFRAVCSYQSAVCELMLSI